MTEKELAAVELRDFKTEPTVKLEAGITYQGSFRIDPTTGAILVRPYQPGNKPWNLKKVVDGDNHAIYLSRHLVRIVISLPKTESDEIRKRYQQVIIECYKNLCELAL